MAKTPRAGGKVDDTIFVGVRLRPFLGYEGKQQCLTPSRNVISVRAPDKKKEYAFDCVMDSMDPSKPNHVSQEKCYDMIGRRMVQHSISGYHACLFCYGQTGSGKTFSFMGKKSTAEQGLLPRLLRDLFSELEQVRKVDCRVQILEIYNEKVRDLLDDKDAGKSPEIHVHPRIGVYVDGAVDAQVESVDQVQKLLDSGLSRASVAATARNARSSRGHVVFRLVIERHEEDHTVVTSELFCVDLAGRENEKTTKVTGQNFTELTFINRSLMWLAQCIQALGKQAQARRRSSVGSEVEGSNRARFRNSKLTLLLINALTGNSKTCLLATVSPALVNLDESLVTLNFASTVKTIKVAARRAERRDTVKLVQSLSEELASLREQLSGSPRNASDLQAQVGTLQNMMESYKTRWEEAEHNAELLRKEKEDALQNLAVSRWKFAQATLKNEARDEPNSARGQETPSQDKDHRDPGARAKALSDSTRVAPGSVELSFCMGRTPADSSTWPPTPSLVLYSKDPGFNGRLIFHAADEGRQYNLGCSLHCDFRLPETPGLGAATYALWQESGRLFIKQTGKAPLPSAAVEVNGRELQDAQELVHQDMVVLQSFRFLAFTKLDPALQALLFGPGVAGSTGPRARPLLPVGQLDFVKQASLARSLIDEASALSKCLSLGFTYELLTLAPVPSFQERSKQGAPSLCIRVSKAGNAPVEVALWDLSTFQDRLNLLRQARQSSTLRTDRPGEAGVVVAVPEPWHRLSYSQGKLMYPLQQAPVLAKPVPVSHQNGVACTQGAPLPVRLLSPCPVNPQRGSQGPALIPLLLQGSIPKAGDRLTSVASPLTEPIATLSPPASARTMSPTSARHIFEI